MIASIHEKWILFLEVYMHKKDAYKVSIITIIINCFLSFIKLLAGFLSNSKALISDGIHSLGDLVTTIIVMIGIHLSSHKEDDKHQYGHERMECIVAIILAGVLFALGLSIGLDGIEQIIYKSYKSVVIIGNVGIIAAIVSIIIKEWLFWYTRGIAKKIQSSALLAEAWHHRTDVVASIGSLVGVVLAKMGYTIGDSIASIIISLFILKTSICIFNEAVSGLIDKACDEDVLNNIKEIILNNDDIVDIKKIRSRCFSSKVYLDIDIMVDSNIDINELYKIINKVNIDIKDKIDIVKGCRIEFIPILENNIDT